MIDFHNHIIPNIDDGAKSVEMAIDMLKEAQKQGITDIVSTIHYQHPKMDGKNTDFSFVNNKCIELKEAMNKEQINIKIHLGAEVFYLPNLTKILDNPLVTIGNGRFMLIEFQTRILPPNYLEELFKLQNEDIIPIIAHPERYSAIQDNLDLAKDWLSRGFIMQIDCGSILGHFGKKCQKTSLELIEYGYIQLIGSDAHNNKIRNFCLKPAYNKINKIFGPKIVEKLKNNSVLLLEGKSLEIIDCINIADNNDRLSRMDKFINLIKRRKK